MNFLKNASTQQKSIVELYVAHFEGKKKLLIFVHFYWFDQKQLFKQIQTFRRIWPFSNLLRKINIQSISVQLSEIVTFLTTKGRFQ